jgi:nucleotide-binding universal stress UspA family protein
MGLALARCFQAELHVVRVESRFRVEAGGADAALRARVENFVASVNVDGRTVETVVLTGNPVDAVVEYSASISGELIVVGQNGRRGSPYWSAGQFAKEVAQRTGSPTITVPKDYAPRTGIDAPFNNILCAIDFSPSSTFALTQAIFVAQQNGARLTLLHVSEHSGDKLISSQSSPPSNVGTNVEELRRKLKSLLSGEALRWPDIEADVVTGTAHDAIVATASEREADLIVIGQPRRTPHRIVMESTVGAVLRRARCPVLTVPSSPIGGDVASTSAVAVTTEDGHMPSLACR